MRVGVLFALPQERKAFRVREAALPDLLVACSGAGKTNAAKGAHQLLEQGVECLIICGFGGGLVDAVVPGTLLLANKVLDCTTEPSSVYLPSAELLQQAQCALGLYQPLSIGPLATVGRVLLNPLEKQAFLATLLPNYEKPLGVDMETAGAAQVAIAQGCAWIALRAITDGYLDSMPFDFNVLTDAKGQLLLLPFLQAILRRPHKLPALFNLGKHAHLAAQQLSYALQSLIHTLQESAP